MGLRRRPTIFIIEILDHKDTVKRGAVTRPAKAAAKRRAQAAVREYGVELARFRSAVDAAAGLNATDVDCLRLLFLQGQATPSELARRTGLSSGATTALLDRLERAGLIARKPNPDDRRGSLVTPTPASVEKMAGWFASARKAQDDLLARHSADELAFIAEVFEQFARLWSRERAKVEATR